MTTRSAFKFVVILALVFALAGGYGVFTAKASMKSASSAMGVTGVLPVASPVEKLAKTVNVAGVSFATLPVATFTLIDGATISCPAPCSFSGDNWLQIGASATSNWAILTYVDGVFIGLGGPFLGPVGTDYTANSWSDFQGGFGTGSHSVQTFAYMRDAAATAYNYNFNYRTYKP